jgi:hypothetical protein
VGRLCARFGARKVMLVAVGLSVSTSLAYATLQNLAMLCTIAPVSGFAVAGRTILPAQALVTHWFQAFRGRAMGLTLLGIGLGGFLLTRPGGRLLRRAPLQRDHGDPDERPRVGHQRGHPGAGLVFDRTGSYEGAIVACAVGLFLAMLLSLLIRPDVGRAALAQAEA